MPTTTFRGKAPAGRLQTSQAVLGLLLWPQPRVLSGSPCLGPSAFPVSGFFLMFISLSLFLLRRAFVIGHSQQAFFFNISFDAQVLFIFVSSAFCCWSVADTMLHEFRCAAWRFISCMLCSPRVWLPAVTIPRCDSATDHRPCTVPFIPVMVALIVPLSE